MVIEQASKTRIIALDYYDGATEGFALSLGKLGACYFKLIAWDENQDRRLFVVVSISQLVYDKIFGLLSRCNDFSSKKNWLPKWHFFSVKDEVEANNIIESCKNDLMSNGILILANQVDCESVDMFTISDSIIGSVNRAMRSPESLDGWLVKLKKNDFDRL